MAYIDVKKVFGISSTEQMSQIIARDFTKNLKSVMNEPLQVDEDTAKFIGISAGVILSMAIEMSVKLTDAVLISYGIVDPVENQTNTIE